MLSRRSSRKDLEQWRLAAALVFSLSLVAGLSLQFELEKTVSFVATLGFSYTFGSVHDTIVNPRFGRVDLQED